MEFCSMASVAIGTPAKMTAMNALGGSAIVATGVMGSKATAVTSGGILEVATPIAPTAVAPPSAVVAA